jgi:hypothetical protein
MSERKWNLQENRDVVGALALARGQLALVWMRTADKQHDIAERYRSVMNAIRDVEELLTILDGDDR